MINKSRNKHKYGISYWKDIPFLNKTKRADFDKIIYSDLAGRKVVYSDTIFIQTYKISCHISWWLLLFKQIMSHILWSHGLQHARLLCPSISPEFCSDSCWIESVVLSNHLIFHCTLLPLPSIIPSIRGSLSMRGFSSESTLCIRWLKCWSFSISPSNEYSEWLPLGFTSLISLLPKGLSRVFSNTQIFSTQPSLHPALTSIHD